MAIFERLLQQEYEHRHGSSYPIYTHPQIHTYTYTHAQKQSPIDRQNIVEAFVFIILIPIIPNYKYPCVCASGALGICAFVAVFVGFYSHHHHQLHRHEWKDNESPAGFLVAIVLTSLVI